MFYQDKVIFLVSGKTAWRGQRGMQLLVRYSEVLCRQLVKHFSLAESFKAFSCRKYLTSCAPIKISSVHNCLYIYVYCCISCGSPQGSASFKGAGTVTKMTQQVLFWCEIHSPLGWINFVFLRILNCLMWHVRRGGVKITCSNSEFF